MHTDGVLFAAMLLLAAGAASLLLLSRAGFGSVLALIATGVVLGPHGLGLGGDAERLRQAAEFGVVCLLFLIGLEMQPARLWRMRRAVFGLGTAQVLVTGLALAAIASWLAGVGPSAALVLGMGLALSSTAFVMQLLHERSAAATAHGQAAFSVLLLQDLAVVPLLALIPLLAGAETELAEVAPAVGLIALMLGALVLLGRWIIPRAFEIGARHRNMEAFTMIAGLAVVAAAWMMEVAGLSMALGGFLMGVLLSDSRYVHQIEAEVAPFKGALLSLFFVAVGMSMDLPRLAAEAVSIGLALVLLLLLKTLLLLALARVFGLPLPVAVRVAFLLPQAGEFGFVLFAAAATAGLLGDTVYQAALLVILLSMAVTPLLSMLGDRLASRLEVAEGPSAEPALADVTLDRHVVIAGFGRVGRNIAFMLEQAQIPYLALDVDVSRVALGRKEGRPVYFGSATEPRVLAQAGVGRAASIVVTLDSPAGVQRVVDTIRSLHPHVPLFVRARDLGTRDRLIEAGVSEAIPETIQLSLSLGEAVLRRVGASDGQVEAVIEAVRQDNYANLRLGAIRGRMAEVGRREGAS